MGFAKPIEQYLFSNLLIRIHVFMYLKDIIRGGTGMKWNVIGLLIVIAVTTLTIIAIVQVVKKYVNRKL